MNSRKRRERENPCGVCGHYHKYEEGEVCGVCGHHMPVAENPLPFHTGAFPSEILPGFLYLGSHDNATRYNLLEMQGISSVLSAVPSYQNLYKFTMKKHCVEQQDDPNSAFEDAIQFLKRCERDNSRVLVYCMWGRNRSAAFVIAFLMRSKGWRLEQSIRWVKERRPCVELTQAVLQQLEEFERRTFGSN